ncbi:hypothetical protein VU07_05290, partial [Desulfobulbus sp. F4]|nr:hypothetical protein [Desulfobulbus sp. F4]
VDVDSTLTSTPWGDDYLYDNSFTSHKLLRLMEADGLEQIRQNMWADAGDFYVPGKRFTDATCPNSRAYSGYATGVQVTNIASAGNGMTCDIAIETPVSVPAPPSLPAILRLLL